MIIPCYLPWKWLMRTKNVTKADIFYKRTIRPRDVIDKVENAQEALHISLSEYNRVDIPYMLSLYLGNRKEMLQELKGLIYQNPVLAKEEDPNRSGKPQMSI